MVLDRRGVGSRPRHRQPGPQSRGKAQAGHRRSPRLRRPGCDPCSSPRRRARGCPSSPWRGSQSVMSPLVHDPAPGWLHAKTALSSTAYSPALWRSMDSVWNTTGGGGCTPSDKPDEGQTQDGPEGRQTGGIRSSGHRGDLNAGVSDNGDALFRFGRGADRRRLIRHLRLTETCCHAQHSSNRFVQRSSHAARKPRPRSVPG